MSVKLRLLQKWGGYQAGDIVQFDESKAGGLLRCGVGEKVSPRERALNVAEAPPARAKGKPRAETATAVPQAETVDVTPKPVTDAAPAPAAPQPHSGQRKAGE